jgi:hypothetical protein
VQCIADMVGHRKQDLTVVDAYRVLKRLGPRGQGESDVLQLNTQILSTDPVAGDAAASSCTAPTQRKLPTSGRRP